METIKFNNTTYLAFQAQGNAAQFAIPFAKHLCKGVGFDIGCNRPEWAFPGATPIDLVIDDEFDAYNLPHSNADYIFSSHCLEHLPHWVEALDYWIDSLKSGGTLFLYLPHFDQEYWRPWNNRKHVHCFTPDVIQAYLESNKKVKNVFVSQRDLNYSFIATCEKN